ncbi:MAG: metallophosphoesterase family protein [Candidatus Syntrophoarchaeum sp.]|nr:metallophosphoesterase family protein [Candidatus Syntrophoarchaeum sp.]
MKVVVLSDTHAEDLADLPERILEDLEKADLIIHAGDYISKNLLEQLRELGDLKGVHGNMDCDEVKRELPDKDIFEVRGFKIGITHPSEGGSPVGLKSRAESKLGEYLDLIIYGHSHKPVNKRAGNTIYFNPGSATGAFPARYKTYGILRIEDEIEVEIVKI